MIKELVIHLGDHKTGSTSIQRALATKNWKCPTATLIYPSRSNHNSLANAIRGGKNRVLLAKLGERLRQKLLQSDADYGVISAEHFEHVSPYDLERFLKCYLPELMPSVRLISYIRPHADRLLSSFAERTKLGNRFDSAGQLHRRLLSRGVLMYAPRMRVWRDVFGHKIVFKPFIRSLLDENDAVVDFFRFVFGVHSLQIDGSLPSNESLCLEDLVMLREVQSVLRQRFGSSLDLPTLQRFGIRIAVVLARSGSNGTRLRLHSDLVQEVIAAYREDAMAVDQEFFTENPMLSALEEHRNKAVPDEQSLRVGDYYSQESIRHMRCWAEFIGHIMATNQQNFLANSVALDPLLGST